jgi:glycosyltransferase involved in cell wall biosynthesis
MPKLAIITSHPIQYNDPWFKLLAEKIAVKVFYTWEQSKAGSKFDPGFKRIITWDIPLLEGYEYTFVKNVSKDPGTHHYKGIINPTLIKEVKAWNPDSLLVIGWSFHSHIRCMRYFHKKIPIFFRGDSHLLNEKAGLKKILRRIFLTWVYKHVDYPLYVGSNNREYYLAHGLTNEQLVFAPHAIDNDRFNRSAGNTMKANEWRRQLGINEGDFVVLYAGKLETSKNPGFMIELGNKLPDTNVKFLIVGNGEQESALKEKVKGDRRYVFLDFQNQLQMPIVYRMGNVFILPAFGPETWGLAVNEAMACGLPVIVTHRIGCAVDLVEDNKNGIVITPSDIDKCSELILKLSRDRNYANAMGERSWQMIQEYSFDRIVASIVNQLNKLTVTKN